MNNKDTVFYRGNQSILVDFSASEISSDGSLVLPEKIDGEHKRIKKFSKHIPDRRDKRFIKRYESDNR